RSPAGLKGGVEQVAVGVVLDEEAVWIAPVVEDLTALDVAADTPRPSITPIQQELAARGDRVEVADLERRVHVAVPGPEREGEGVVVGGDRPQVAAHKAHDGAPLALPLVVEEVTDDEAEVLQIPVEAVEIVGALEHHVSDSLDPRRFARRALGGVDAGD